MPYIITQTGDLTNNGDEAIAIAGKGHAHSSTLRSEAVAEIISAKPPFLIRWGTTIFFIVLLCIVAACWFIRYPDIVPAKAILTSVNAPKEVTTKTAGKLEQLLVTEDQLVKKNTVLGYPESRADAWEIIRLSTLVDSIQVLLNNHRTQLVSALFLAPQIHLGEIQEPYQTFVLALSTFRQYL